MLLHLALLLGSPAQPSAVALPPAAAHVGRSATPLASAIVAAVTPQLQQLSAQHGNSSWAFAYRDADTSVELCAGYSDVAARTACRPAADRYAWGSTTKPYTATLVLQLLQRGAIGTLDDSAAAHINPYLRAISANASDLYELFAEPAGAMRAVTVRHLLQMQSGIQEFDDPFVRQWQNADEHRAADYSPEWVLRTMNRTFSFAPGSSGGYSSTNYVLLGLLAARYAGAADWDRLDQASWMASPVDRRADFGTTLFAAHGLLENFTTAVAGQRGASVHGYQPVCRQPPPPPPHPQPPHAPLRSESQCVWPNQSDVHNMSSSQGWTCGNMVAAPRDVARFFWELLGPPSANASSALLAPPALAAMRTFVPGPYFGARHPFGYGLGLMNFTSMNWGYQNHGEFIGHNGLTYGFGAQSGYNYDLRFASALVNNAEHWIGPDSHGSGDNALYAALVQAVKRFRPPSRRPSASVVADADADADAGE